MDFTQLKSSVFHFSEHEGICLIAMNDERKSVNSLTMEMFQEMERCLPQILSANHLMGIVIYSTKPNCFAAGADISIFDSLKTAKEGEAASRQMHQLLQYFADAKVPTVAAIHGTCLGGGLELSMACHYRICTSHPSTQLGLPEVQLGILPGGGGTQRLPRLIGISQALDMILTGKKIGAKKALKLGLVDDVVPENQLLKKAIALCQSKLGQSRKLPSSLGIVSSLQGHFDPQKALLESNFLGRSLISKKSHELIMKNTKGHYPAPVKALDAVMKGTSTSLEKGLEIEASLFGELVVTKESRSLVHVFNTITAAKKNPYSKEIQEQAKKKYLTELALGNQSVGILGAGLMGSGISTVMSDKSIRNVMIDKDPSGLQRGLGSIASYFSDRFRKKRIKWFERDTKTSHSMSSLDFASLKNSSVVVEAVFEDVSIKHTVLKKCEQSMKDADFIFATNTSSIPIHLIAQGGKKPENVIGMHFFSPVPKMPLVEIIVTKDTSPVVASCIFDLASKMGKQIIVVNDGPGFYTTRILAFQVSEALNILSEGAKIEDIDGALEKFGMPVGPITLLDEVGIDVAGHIIQVLFQAFGERIQVPAEIEKLQQDNRKGRKNSKGFYTYKDGKKSDPDSTIYDYFSKPRAQFDQKEIADRCVYAFLNEAAHCLDQGILRSEQDGDLGAIFGLGFPPFLGGPFHYAKTLGKAMVKARLEELAEKYGSRFKPAAYWNL